MKIFQMMSTHDHLASMSSLISTPANRKSKLYDSITFTYCHCFYFDENVSHLDWAVADLMAKCCASVIPRSA